MTITDSTGVYSEHSYKYYFSQWGISKNVPISMKEAAIVALGKRVRDNNSTPAILYNNQAINKKRLIRHINDAEKKRNQADNDIQLKTNV
jgi:hypothetical protein